MRLVHVSVLVSCLLVATALAGQNPMRPGQWEVTTQMHMPNLPMQMPEMKVTQCITPEQLEDPASALPSGAPAGNPGQDCKISDYETSGNTVSWKMECTAPQKMTGNGEITFTDDTYNGTMTVTMPQGEMTMKLAAKRLGDCTP